MATNDLFSQHLSGGRCRCPGAARLRGHITGSDVIQTVAEEHDLLYGRLHGERQQMHGRLSDRRVRRRLHQDAVCQWHAYLSRVLCHVIQRRANRG